MMMVDDDAVESAVVKKLKMMILEAKEVESRSPPLIVLSSPKLLETTNHVITRRGLGTPRESRMRNSKVDLKTSSSPVLHPYSI